MEPVLELEPAKRSFWARLQRPGGLWQQRDFVRLWTAQTVSQFGSTMTREALPYTAILVLGASPFQMGLLGAVGSAPLLVLGLFAGVWVDRVRRRPLMIAADLIRALLLLSIPLAYLFGTLTMTQLYVVAALTGVLSVLFEVAYRSFLPSVIAREQLVEGNSKLGVSDALAEIGGPSAGGALVQLISGPLAVLFDAISFLFSAVTLARIRAVEQPPEQPVEQQHIRRDLVEGLRAVFAHPLLRPITLNAMASNFFGWFFGALYGLYALELLGRNPALVGITVACGGIGSLVGAVLAEPLVRRLGVGPAILAGLLISATTGWLTLLAGATPLLALPLLMAAQLVGDAAATAAMINTVSLRQAVTPDRLLGRVNASSEVLGTGIGTLGVLTGGALAELIGLQTTIAVAVAGGFLAALWLLASPLRTMREAPTMNDER